MNWNVMKKKRVRRIPVIDYKIMDDTNIISHKSTVTPDERGENSSPSCNLEQEIRELLLALKSDEQVKDKNNEDSQVKTSFPEMNISTRPTSHSMNENISSSNGSELIAVTVSDLTVGTLQTEEEQNENSDDEKQKKKSEGIGSDNRISRKKRNVKKKHKSICTDEKPCIFEQSKYFTPSPNLVALKNITTGNLSQDVVTSTELTHKRICTKAKSFKCKICNKCFTTRDAVMCHKITHIGRKAFTCEECFKFFTSSSHLSCHKRIHTGEKSFTCDACYKSFSSRGNLNRHARIHIHF